MPTLRRSLLLVLLLFEVSVASGQEHETRGVLREPVRLDREHASLLINAKRDLDERVTWGLTELSFIKKQRRYDRAKGVLGHWVEMGMSNLEATRAELKKRSSDDLFRQATDACFDDLVASYQGARDGVERATIENEKDLNWTSDGVDAVFAYTSHVYSRAANARSLTFDLEVTSDPPDATIHFYRKGESPTQHSRNTNCTIHNLVYARWFVEVHRDGFKDQVKEHDATRETTHELPFKLIP